MLKEIKILAGLNLRNLYGINVFRYSKDRGARSKAVLLMACWVVLIVMLMGYVGALVFGFVYIGMGEIAPAYLITIASLIMLFLGIFKAGPVIFQKKGYDILSSLPVSQSNIVISRFMRMYVENLIFGALVMVSGMAVYGYCLKPGPGFYIMGLLVTLLLPLAPMTVATIVGALITAITSRMKHQSIAGALLSVLLVMGTLVLTNGMATIEGNLTQEMMADFVEVVTGALLQLYPPAIWMGNAIVYGEIGPCLGFMAVQVVLLAAVVAVISAKYQTISQNLYSTTAKHDYSMEKLKQTSVIGTLYKKELKRYLASNVYVTNTIIGPIIGTILSGTLLVTGLDTIEKALPIAIDIGGLVPFMVAAAFCMMTTTSTSISMEGKEWWIAKSLPLSAKSILDSKILLNLSLMIPFYIVSEVMLAIALRPEFLELIWMILIPLVIMVFSCVYGITVNLCFPVFNWESEATVVKQSATAAIGGLGGAVIGLVCMLVAALVPAEWTDLVNLLICIVLLAVTALLYRRNNKVDLAKL